MNKFFSKYLPVEGDIKAGDWYLLRLPFSTELTLMQCQDKKEAERCNNHDVIAPNCKKAKLFLCSRDIQRDGERRLYDEELGWGTDYSHTNDEVDVMHITFDSVNYDEAAYNHTNVRIDDKQLMQVIGEITTSGFTEEKELIEEEVSLLWIIPEKK